jgi:hypothetical protein
VPWGSAPIGWSGRTPGEGFRIGHGYACENTWFAPGWWHTGEDWYAIEGNAAGALALAIADGEIAYAGYDYPGHVVIVRHATDLYAVYGHLAQDSTPDEGTTVAAGDVLGSLLDLGTEKGPGVAPSHLHFELRTFLVRDDVNGNAPQYGVSCGFQCPPGPGYWPISANEHPSAMGWRNPSHLRLGMMEIAAGDGVRVVAIGGDVAVRDSPDSGSEVIGELAEGETAIVVGVDAGDSATSETSAEGYVAWLELESGGWIQALVPSDAEAGSDGRPSSLDVVVLVTG